ncbi:transmembrane protein 43 homolog isoform X1 [Nasonia vitripennis]|uniref:Transmembrane protein 43 homolog n=1 Tax=Nasonia vitripennis TaxID=7425 RepID=A0A7M7GFW5_NASVI|nr:transmembrane protein 43 homolog isoform X1 [Nasonia vitripennis]
MYRANQNGHPHRSNTATGQGAMYRNRANSRYYQRHRQDQESNSVQATVMEQFKESWLTAIIGLILFATGMCLFVWNEGRAVKMAYSLDEALNNVAVIQNSLKPVPELEGRLVYLSGPLKVSEPLTEPDYGVMVASVKLRRRAQMYQWIEIEEERSYPGSLEQDKHYYYTTEWKDKLIDSNDFYIKFGHENPTEMPVKSQTQISEDVRIGNFALGMELKKKFNDFVEVTSDERPERRDIKMHSGLYYHSSDLWEPKVGDIRVQLSYAGKGGDVYSVVGKLVNGVVEPYITTHGQEILLQRKHAVSVDQMFHLEHVDNYWRTWTIRGLGWLVMFLAATCLANILKTIILNSNVLCGIIAIESLTMSVSMSISLLVIGFAWVWYRPVIGLGLALASILPFMYSTYGSSSSAIPPQQQRENYRRL